MGAVPVLALVGHLLGDWVVQTDWQAAEKVRSWRANQAHVATYHVTLAVLVGPAWHDRWALFALAVSWASHSLLDRRWPVRWIMVRSGSGVMAEKMWGVIAVDQALHLSILLLLSLLAGV